MNVFTNVSMLLIILLFSHFPLLANMGYVDSNRSGTGAAYIERSDIWIVSEDAEITLQDDFYKVYIRYEVSGLLKNKEAFSAFPVDGAIGNFTVRQNGKEIESRKMSLTDIGISKTNSMLRDFQKPEAVSFHSFKIKGGEINTGSIEIGYIQRYSYLVTNWSGAKYLKTPDVASYSFSSAAGWSNFPTRLKVRVNNFRTEAFIAFDQNGTCPKSISERYFENTIENRLENVLPIKISCGTGQRFDLSTRNISGYPEKAWVISFASGNKKECMLIPLLPPSLEASNWMPVLAGVNKEKVLYNSDGSPNWTIVSNRNYRIGFSFKFPIELSGLLIRHRTRSKVSSIAQRFDSFEKTDRISKILIRNNGGTPLEWSIPDLYSDSDDRDPFSYFAKRFNAPVVCKTMELTVVSSSGMGGELTSPLVRFLIND